MLFHSTLTARLSRYSVPGAVALVIFCFAGCVSRELISQTAFNETSRIDQVSAKVDNHHPEIVAEARIVAPFTPRSIEDLDSISYLDMSLDSILAVALNNNEVLRDLGGTILRNPEILKTRFLPAAFQTDPRFSMEAALSAFDAQLAATAYFNNNDQTYNNPFFAGGTNTFRQDEHDYTVELSKLTATGSRFALRNVTNYDSNNAPGNIFPNAWDTYVEGELRKPLLQGGGLQFNRIAGPGAAPGIYNGVLIAKVNNDITQSDFELTVNEYVSNVINAYWDLYLAYRTFDAKRDARDSALETWRQLKADEGEDPTRVSLAAEQYFRLKAEVDEALSGRLVQGTQVRNGSSGGTLRGSEGVQVAERRLRLLIGMPVADGQMLRPADEPEESEIVFDWNAASEEAVFYRPELRAQQLRIRKREMELLAARNFISPRLDAVGRYRFRGFGDDLINQGGIQSGPRPASAVGNLVAGDLQEWQLGVELTVPIGFRRAHLAVSNAELLLSRERVIQREQQKQVVHDLVNAIADAERAYLAAENNLNRYLSATEVVEAYEVKAGNFELDADRVLDAQRRLMDAQVQYFQSRTEYAVALKNVHFEKGSLMAYTQVGILDGSAASMGYADTEEQQSEVELISQDSQPSETWFDDRRTLPSSQQETGYETLTVDSMEPVDPEPAIQLAGRVSLSMDEVYEDAESRSEVASEAVGFSQSNPVEPLFVAPPATDAPSLDPDRGTAGKVRVDPEPANQDISAGFILDLDTFQGFESTANDSP